MKRVETDTGYDGIKLESRSEVDDLENILRDWLENHPGDDRAEVAEKAARILESMWYEW